MLTREEVLAEAASIITGNREESYGKPEDSFSEIAQLWTWYVGKPIYPGDVAKMMILLKIVRSGHTEKRDNYVDIAGYAAIACELAEV